MFSDWIKTIYRKSMSATKKEDEKEKKVDNLSEAQVLKSTGLDDEDEFEEFPIHEAALGLFN